MAMQKFITVWVGVRKAHRAIAMGKAGNRPYVVLPTQFSHQRDSSGGIGQRRFCLLLILGQFFKGFFGVFSFYVRYSTLPHLPPLRFHCVGRSWDWTQDSCDYGIGCLFHTRLDLIHNRLDLIHTRLDLILGSCWFMYSRNAIRCGVHLVNCIPSVSHGYTLSLRFHQLMHTQIEIETLCFGLYLPEGNISLWVNTHVWFSLFTTLNLFLARTM